MAHRPYKDLSYAFGPGPPTPAIKLLIYINIGVFLIAFIVPDIVLRLGFSPKAIVEQLTVWQFVTYMFLHGDVFHFLFNMLSLWDVRDRARTHLGYALFHQVLLRDRHRRGAHHAALGVEPAPLRVGGVLSTMIGASGAIYGVLLAYAFYFPRREILMYFVFPIPARYFVMIMGAIAFLSLVGSSGSGVAHTAHAGSSSGICI